MKKPHETPMVDGSNIKELCEAAARDYVNVRVPMFGGFVRLYSGSGPLEAVWIKVLDENDREVRYDRATGGTFQPAVRITPRQARILSEVLFIYATHHADTEDE